MDNEEFFKFYDNDNSASSVSSALGAVDYTTSDGSAGNPKSDKSGELSGAKSGKSSGVSIFVILCI